MTHDQARRTVRPNLRSVAASSKQAGMRGPAGRWVRDCIADLRYGFRQLARNRLFTIAAVATLALAIGACSSIFSVVNAVLLRKLPYKNANRLILVWGTGGRADNRDQISYTDLQDWRKNSRSFEEMANFHSYVYALTDPGATERIRALQISDGYFRVMQSAPLLGRYFIPDDFLPGRQQVAILSYDYWRQKFGGDPAVVGKTISLNLHPFVIIGVAPHDLASLPDSVIFRPPSELYTPVVADYSADNRSDRFLRGIALIKPGVPLSRAQAEMNVLVDAMQKRYPNEDGGRGVHLVPLKDDLVRNLRSTLIVLQLAVFMVLLIACANVANLLLARSTARQREMAIRGALGASRGRIARQVLTESTLLAFCGGMLGIALAYGSVRFLVHLGSNVLPEMSGVSIDMPVLIFTSVLCVVTGLLFGTAPAFHISAMDIAGALKAGVRSVGLTRLQASTRVLLVAAEVAVSVVLLIGAGLLMKSFALLQHVDPGFDPRHVAMTYVFPPRLRDAPVDQQQAYFQRLLERISKLPGIEDAAITSGVPDSGDFDSIRLDIQGRTFSPGQRPITDRFVISPGYFSTLRIPLLSGRLFDRQDDLQHPRVVIVNRLLADRLFPGEDPIGKRVRIPTPGNSTDQTEPWWTIVGVVGDVVQNGLASRKTLQVYAPYTQYDCAASNLLFRTRGDPQQPAREVRTTLREFDSMLIAPEFDAMQDVVAGSIVEQRFSTTLLMIFGISGLLLAAIGIYSVVSFVVAQRTSEIGTRIALGSTPSQVVALVVRQGIRPVIVGALAGVAICLPATRLLEHQLFKTERLDPLTFVVVFAVLLGASLLACYVPAYRASRIDPIQALRAE